MLSYLMEIGCEELPAGFIPSSTEYLVQEFSRELSALGLSFTNIVSGGSPRRLYISVEELPEKQEDRSEIIMGPPAGIAFDEKGRLTEAAKKFAKAKNINEDTLKKIHTPKGEYLQGERKTGGETTAALLQKIVPEIIKNIPFPKSMRWGSGDFRFARPVHWFLSILSGEIIPFEIGGLKASNLTYGHRFLSPGAIETRSFEQYKEALAKAFVIIDGEERKNSVREQLKSLEEKEGVNIPAEEDLLNTVAGLVEYPVAVMGSFDGEFLRLPPEVLITSMKTHQKYFPVTDAKGKLLGRFAGVSNMVLGVGERLIQEGYERVLKARLSDALFFYENDKAVPLEKRAEALKKVVYQEKLGSIYAKSERFGKLVSYLAEKFAPDKKETAALTAALAKADLMTEMVYEFPELQGIMGSYYARMEGKPEEVCLGIREHYLPRFAGDALPKSWEGRLVSVADKLDTIAGAFASGIIPTGNLDPYGLRRCAIGVLSILEDGDMRIDLREPVELALENFEGVIAFDKKDASEKIIKFINQRWKQMLVSRGDTAGDIFDAVEKKFGDPIAVYNLAKVLTGARGSDNFQIIAGSFKRINNILKKSGWRETDYSKDLFNTEEERTLAALIENQSIGRLIENEKNYAALDELMKFAPAVDAFFDKVMVMAEDEALRANRLSLIAALRSVFLSVGDMDAISV